MNSSESSVIVLDSDDEEDQSKSQLLKTSQSKANITKSLSHSIHSSLQNVRNSVTVTNQQAKSKNTTIPHTNSVSIKQNTNSVSITPLNQSQKSGSNNGNQISKNPQVSKVSPKSSPRNSPNLRMTTNSGLHLDEAQSSASSFGILQRKTPPTPHTHGKISQANQNLENLRNNNEVTLPENVNAKSILNQNQIKGNHNSPAQSTLKRKIDNGSDNIGFNTSNKSHQKTPSNYKRIKPTMVSATLNPKYSQASNTITIDDDDDDYFGNISKSKQMQKSVKSRSNSITSSDSGSPTSSTSTSPQSQRSPTTPISLKDLNRTTQKGVSTIILGNNTLEDRPEKANLGASSNLDKDKSQDVISDKSVKDLQISSNSPITNGNMNTEVKADGKQKNEIIPAFDQLIEACKKSDKSGDMELLIEKKLLKYYHSIHPDFITSKSFKKTVENITSEILETPNLVYIKLKTIIEELKSRKNSKVVVVSNDGQTSTGNDEVDEQVRKLNKGLRKLKHIIAKLEEQEVDWDTDFNSSYLKVEKFKKRACEIYEKICDLTGESKHAQRTVRKPIIFDHTAYPKINKAIETFVNKTKTFPDFHDILTILQHCNRNYKLDLTSEELKRLAQDAFVKVGRLLQNRRKTDLYETLSQYTENIKDPALEDQDLNAKLNENKKHYGKINALIQKYAREQDTLQSEKLKAKEESRKTNLNVDSVEESVKNKSIPNVLSQKEKNNNIKDNKESPNDEKIKSPSRITEEMRNTPSCSNNSRNNNNNENKNQENQSNDKNSDKIKTPNNCEISKNFVGYKETSNTNSNKNSSKGNNSDIESNKFLKAIQSETVTNNRSSITSNVNINDKSKPKPTIKIINVASLSEQYKTTSSSLVTQSSLDKSNISPTKPTNSKSIVPSSLAINNVSKNKFSNKEIEVDEIILSDDDV